MFTLLFFPPMMPSTCANRSDSEAGCRESGYVKTSRIDNQNHIVFGDTIGDTNNPIRIERTEFLDVSGLFGYTATVQKRIAKISYKAGFALKISRCNVMG